ncbi:hypothetical protein [Marinoscillum furvescens]|uniref:Uncharacterized protein n=1 Tax=Marinoscillum furvescens DSM 4134 TaxID=1122208 RepID=A0A3D9KYM9_MARFU|nr:hypothetical protein [Marinoscillum furvescens]RED94395.1 hypothetical protein C7460_12182 [Marinoscillum furvescens DSM 4134]
MKTDIRSVLEVQLIADALDQCVDVKKWTVDTEDVDKVLRIEATGSLCEQKVQQLILPFGFYCEDLPN